MEIGPIFIGAQPTTFSATFGGTGLDASSGGSSSSSGTYHGARGTGGREHDAISSARRGIDDAYKRASRNIPALVKEEVKKAQNEAGTNSLPLAESLNHEISVYDKLIAEKILEIKNLTPVAQEFNGGDPLVVSFNDIREKAKTTPAQSKYLVPMIVAMRLWDSSYKAGTQIKLLNEMIAELNTQSNTVKASLEVAKTEAAKATAARQAETEKMKDNILWATNFYESLSKSFGERTTVLAKELANNARGKKIRSSEEAIQTFNKYKDSINKKFSAKDKEAILKGIDSVDMQTLAKVLLMQARFLAAFLKV